MLKHKKWFLLVALATIMTLVLPACGPGKPTEPKTLIVCQGQEPDTLYIWGGSMLAASHIQTGLYEQSTEARATDSRSFGYQATITEKLPSLDDGDAVIETVTVKAGDKVVDDTGEPVELAEGVMIRPAGCYSSDCAIAYDGSSEVQMEQMKSTFTLVEGLTWADGTAVKASDSAYSFKLASDPDTPNPSRYTEDRTASYEAPDDRTIVWAGLPGYRDSQYMINIWIPLPEHILGEMSAADIVESEEASRTPIGYGSFTMKEWVTGDHITVVKNEHYFRADEGLPKVDEVVYRFIEEDPNAAIAALLAGECDILTQDLSLEGQAELLIEKEEEGALVPTFVTGTVWEHVDFGINPVEEYADTRPDLFEDVRIRQAIAMCLDRQTVVDELLYGKSVVIHSYIPEEHPLYNDQVKQYPYDPAAAMALLDDMGWTDEDGDGVRECNGCDVEGAEDGDPLAFKWGSTDAPLRVNAMQIFQVNLKECGFDVTLENLPASEWFADGPEGPLFGRHFDLGEFAWLTGVDPPCQLYLTSEWPSEEGGWAGQNNPGYTNPEFDKVCNAAIQSLPGTPEYEQNHKESQRIFAEELPVVPLYLRLKLAAYRPEVQGFIMDTTINSEMWNIENFDLVEEEGQ
jgi:peptide/nickel transport system substrate-binding protein